MSVCGSLRSPSSLTLALSMPPAKRSTRPSCLHYSHSHVQAEGMKRTPQANR